MPRFLFLLYGKLIKFLSPSLKKDESFDQRKQKERAKGESDLEMNHSHYLMVDDGTVHDYDLKDYRTRLAIHMARLEHDDDINSTENFSRRKSF